MANVNAPQLPPTELELQTFAAFLVNGAKRTAVLLDVPEQTVKNRISNLYARLGARGYVEAGVRLGWMQIPDEFLLPVLPKECGWVGHCSRSRGHTGQHGGFRAHGAAA